MDRTLETVDLEEDEPPRRRPPGGFPATVVLMLLAGLFLGWSALSFLELDVGRYTSALVALTQYAVPVGVVITLLGLVLRRWLIALVVGLVSIALIMGVAPRAIPDAPTTMQGTPLRLLSINMHLGEADARRIVTLVRENRIDVLSLQELTSEAVTRLDRAGLKELLPHRVFQPGAAGAGSGIAARYPLRELSLVPATTLNQPSALVDLPGKADVELVAVHPMFPVGQDTTSSWRKEIQALPDPVGENNATPRVLLGDFNATLDHTPLRRLIGRGYADAAEITGDGLAPTWPGPGKWLPPPVTIDHLLVSGKVTVRGYQTFDVAKADHRAIMGQLLVPG